MKIPLAWVSLYSPLTSLLTKHSIKELAHEYSIHTAEIDNIEEHFLGKVIVGKVLSSEKHPESKKLSIVEVDLGEHGHTVILTGAPNITEARYVPVAMVGAILPGDFVIGERMMAGMMSRGMICGADEISMSSEESHGIMVLEDDWEEGLLEDMLGKSFFDLTLPFPGRNGEIYRYALKDTTFEIDNKFITNRPDLFSVIGNAREFHAVFETPLHTYPSSNDNIHTDKLSTHIETDRVLSYHLMKMTDITVGKSPYGISLMMERASLAPKMDIVDITNLIMTEMGQPMHAFDADKITGNITVRMAKNGEKILALNGNEYTLTEDDMVIADEGGPVALAGVIGGMESAVSESTKNIVWESACFDATSVRMTAQRHSIRTDASTRYEKSLDPLLAGTTFPRVLEYMEFLGKSRNIIGTSSYLDTSRVQNIALELSYTFIEKKIGLSLEKEKIHTILHRLGFKVTPHGKSMNIIVPSWRASKDISIQEDIVEEIARVIGYAMVRLTPLPVGQPITRKNTDILLRDATLNHFRGEKYHEIYTYSFTSESLDQKILLQDMESAIGIQNAFNEEYTHMRRSLAPRILIALSENIKHTPSFGFFELGKIYGKNINTGLDQKLLQNIAIAPFPEKKMIAGVTIGRDITHIRKVIEGYLEQVLGYIPPLHTGCNLPFIHPGISGSYKEGDTTLFEFGEIHPEVALSFGVPEDALYFEGDFSEIRARFETKDLRFHPISRYQTIPRELNFIMKDSTPTGDVARIIDALHPWIQDVSVSSVYVDRGKIGEGKKSVNFAFTLSNADATISDDEAMHVQNMIIDTLKIHGYELRAI